MNIRKIVFFLTLSIFIFTTISCANNIDNELVDMHQIEQDILQTSSTTSNIPELNSRAALVFDRTTKTILYNKNINEVRKMASTTKIMTAIVVIENSNLYDTVTISKKAASTGGSTLGIKKGDKITICDLLYGLLLKSGNDAAVALAENVGGTIEGFAEMMNKKAKELDLKNTHFVTPHGLDNDNHYTTAYELALLTDYALNNQTFYNLVSTKDYTITINGFPKTISNTNELLGNLNGIYGVKTGFTNGANRCLVTACKRDNLDIICIVLGADTKRFRTQDSIKLIEYTYKTFEMIDLKNIVTTSFNEWKSNYSTIFFINKGKSNNIDLVIQDFKYNLYPIKKDFIKNISTQIECNYNLDSPIEENSIIGYIQVKTDEDSVLKFNIMNTNKIERKSCFSYILEILSKFFKYLTIKY